MTPVAHRASGSVRAGIGAHLEAVELVRTFGSQRAVDGVSFTLAPGQLLTLLGPNGAGKTTLLKVLAGGLRATSGEVLLGGEPLDLKSPDWLRRVGVLSHQTYLYGHLTARENLAFYGNLYDVGDLDGRVVRGLKSVDLASRADDPVRTFSRGMRQRLAVARTLLHDPDLVLLDEPYTGLDAHAASVLRGVLATLRDGRRTVLLVTHNLTEGLALADRLAVLVRGRLTLDAPIAEVDQAIFPARYRELVETAGKDGP